MANLVVHFEIHASEPQRLIDFYSELLGWKFTPVRREPYWSIDTGEGAVCDGRARPRHQRRADAAVRSGPGGGAPVNGADFVVGVDGSVDDLFQKGLDLGGTEALPLSDMEGIGRVGYLLDPDGNVFGLISPVLSDGTDVMAGQT